MESTITSTPKEKKLKIKMSKKIVFAVICAFFGLYSTHAQWNAYRNEKGKFGLEWGNSTGTIVHRIPARYDSVLFSINPAPTNDFDAFILFSEKRAGVKLGGFWGFIDSLGNLITPLSYDRIGPFIQGFAKVERNGKQTWVNANGKEIAPFIFDIDRNTASTFQQGKCRFSMQRQWGFVDTSGKIIVKPQYRNVGNFSDQMAWVQNTSSGNFGYIDSTGNEVISATRDYLKVYSFSEGLAAIEMPVFDEEDPGVYQTQIGFINKKGELVIPIQYQGKLNPSENEWLFKNNQLSVVLKNGQGAIINRKGEIIQK
jgi:hypothetical protein